MSGIVTTVLQHVARQRLAERMREREEASALSRALRRIADLEKQLSYQQDEIAALRVKLDLERTID